MSDMDQGDAVDVLEAGRQELGLSVGDLWFRYFAVGGMSTALVVDAVLHGALLPTDFDRDLLALALNERFLELDRDHPIPYTTDP